MNPDEILKQQLSAWNPDVEIPPRFQADVWTQIAARESSRRSSFWNPLQDWFATELCKPQLATAVVALGLTLGVGIAHLRAQDSNATAGQQLEARYMGAINPLVHGGHSP